MASGKVKWWDNTKGFGFIAQDMGGDVFVHQSDIVGPGYRMLKHGEEVFFDIVPSDKGPKARNVHRQKPR
jgi:CspA family cold shock protein